MLRLHKAPLITLCTTALLTLSSASFAKGTGYVFVSSEKDNVITVLDSNNDYAVVKQIETGDRPRHIAFNNDRTKIYAACGEGESIDIIDIEKLEVTDRVEEIEDPEAFDVSPDGKQMYISLEDDGALGIMNLDSKEMVAEIEVGEEPEGVLTHPDGKTVFVTSEVANMVHVIDVEKKESIADIVVGKRPRRFAVTPDNKSLWVTNELDASVSFVDLETNKVTGSMKFEPKGFRAESITPVGIVMTKDGKTAYVAMGRANHVAVVDVEKKEVKDYILVGERAWNVTFNKDESLLYVVNGLSDDVSIIDTTKGKVIKSVPVGRVPYMALIDDQE